MLYHVHLQVMLFLNRLFSVFDSLLEEHDAYKVGDMHSLTC